jgi:integrase
MGAALVATSTPGVYRRGGRYVVRYRDPQGRQRQRAAATLAEARALRSAMLADVARGEYRALSRTTFADYAKTWITTYQGRTARGIRPETVADYKRDLDKDAIPFLGRLRLAEIEPRDIKAYAAHIQNRGVRPATVRLAVAPVRALLATAVEDGLIRSNPAAGLRIATLHTSTDVSGETPKALTEDELRRILSNVPDRWRLFVELVAHTGLRIGEAVALRWTDIDLTARRLSVRRRWYRNAYAPPKSRYGRRTIPLTPGMTEKLREHHGPDASSKDALVFPSRAGTPLDPANLSDRVLKPAAQKAGVPWAGWHTLRHTCGTLLFRHGANAKQVQHWLGHHSPAFTLATYVHLLPDDAPDPTFLDHITAGGRGVNQVSPRTPETRRDAALPGQTSLAV